MEDVIDFRGLLNATVNGIRFTRISQYHLSYLRRVYSVSPLHACFLFGALALKRRRPPVLGNRSCLVCDGRSMIRSYSRRGKIRMGSALLLQKCSSPLIPSLVIGNNRPVR